MTLSICTNDRVRIFMAEYAEIIEKSIIACLKWAGTIIACGLLVCYVLCSVRNAVSELQ